LEEEEMGELGVPSGGEGARRGNGIVFSSLSSPYLPSPFSSTSHKASPAVELVAPARRCFGAARIRNRIEQGLAQK